MSGSPRPARLIKFFFIAALAAAIIIGSLVGLALASTRNIRNSENFTKFESALPTRIYDIKDRLVTEFFSDEKREMVSVRELPRHLIDAFITREDETFWKHHGFSFKGIFRAVLGVLTRKNLGGGSTITQQLACTLYLDKRDISIRRKVVELWWALQLERRYTKEEILEMYINQVAMGPGVYGVEAASKYFFGHSAREISLAESAILVIQLAAPTLYNPFRNPNNARARSRVVLDQMVKKGFADAEEADASFNEYWDNFDYTRVASAAYFMRDDKAPWFSEYVRRQLDELLYGSLNYYTDGLSVRTTLDLDAQSLADELMSRGIEEANREFRSSTSLRLAGAETTYIPIVEMLGLTFDLEQLFVSDAKVKGLTFSYYQKKINPTIDATALLFGLPDLKAVANAGSSRISSSLEKTTVEGALITIDNETGYIKAIVGGSKYDQSNQLILATQGDSLMPGSCFKPLYYSAAIDSRKFTEGSLIYDSPVVFYNEDGTPYIPLNYKGEWKGPVLTWYALAHSMNVPSLKILDSIGFDAAIDRAALLLGYNDPATIRRTFPRVYPLGLGVVGVTPLRMARAFAVFANQGREVTPIAIRSVEDRNGRVILEPEKDLRVQQKKKGAELQLISPQNAAVMVDMLQRVVQSGTLAWPTRNGSFFRYKDEQGKDYTIPAAGKTGTTQNWADAWTVGFTPYMTTAIWFGFKKPGNSLGVTQTGAAIAGKYWAEYMRGIHRTLPYKGFTRPQTGLIEVKVCALSGLLQSSACTDGSVSLLFYEGTQPSTLCDHAQYVNLSQMDKLGGQLQFLNNAPASNPDTPLRIDIPGFEQLLNPGASPGANKPDSNQGEGQGETQSEILN